MGGLSISNAKAGINVLGTSSASANRNNLLKSRLLPEKTVNMTLETLRLSDGATSNNGGSSNGSSNNGGGTAYSKTDLVPLSDEIPSDGIIFSRPKSNPLLLVVFRTPDERMRNPERLNLDKRQLDVCPILEQENRLRLLNYQNNNIRIIQHVENLPNLIFLDFYNNKLTTLDGPVSAAKGLRVLMAGKNRLTQISNLTNLKKLDVLDLHSNEIQKINGLQSLVDLRVLNLAGNRISVVENLDHLNALTELNLRRNSIIKISDLDKLHTLQRVFLSHNLIEYHTDITCVFRMNNLLELSLDGNPLSNKNPVQYRAQIVSMILSLNHLDLKKITPEERKECKNSFSGVTQTYNSDEMSFSAGANSNGDGADNMLVATLENFKKMQLTDNGDSGDKTGVEITTLGKFTSGKMFSFDSKQHGIFDIETISPNEKALFVVGDSWEWLMSKRVLGAVTEATVCHLKWKLLILKFASYLWRIPAVKTLKFVRNDMQSLRELLIVLFFVKDSIENFVVMENTPVESLGLFRPFTIAALPNLLYLGEEIVKDREKSDARAKYLPVLNAYYKYMLDEEHIRDLANKDAVFISGSLSFIASSSAGQEAGKSAASAAVKKTFINVKNKAINTTKLDAYVAKCTSSIIGSVLDKKRLENDFNVYLSSLTESTVYECLKQRLM